MQPDPNKEAAYADLYERYERRHEDRFANGYALGCQAQAKLHKYYVILGLVAGVLLGIILSGIA